MTKAHLKRLVAPKTWHLLRKKETFTARPKPGAHVQKLSIPLATLLKQEGHAKTTKEAKKLLHKNNVLIDGRRIKDHRFPVGIMDLISFKETKQHYRVLLDSKGRIIVKQTKNNTSKISKITGKTIIKKKKTQINCNDSRSIIVEKDSYKVGDSIIISVPKQNITNHLKLEKGASILLTGGKHVGIIGKIDSIKENIITFKADHKKNVKTLKKYAFVVDTDITALTRQ
jgi:small subunit ribosomal protein S4e